MTNNLLVLRASPDWMNFDLESTRAYLRGFALPETLIIEFDDLWRRHFKSDFRSIRAQLKSLALQTYWDVRDASLISHEGWDASTSPAGWIAFVDDDDWMSPALFESLPAPRPDDGGVRWGSLRLGRIFAHGGYDQPIIQARPIDRVVYTNNYAVTALALRQFGRASLFEHDAAQKTFDRPDFPFAVSDEYLSCAVKHPCCTMSINYLMTLDSFRSDPRREMAKFMESLAAMRPETAEEWLRKPLQRFREIMIDAVRPR
jgi:hypothetical protein